MKDARRPSEGFTLRLRTQRGVARLTALLLAMTAAGAGLTAGATFAAAAITTPFAPVFSVNTTGDIQLRGNTLMTCPTAATGCAASRNTAGGGTATNNALNDNNYAMVFVDSDSDASTFNSSSSTVNLPTGASVLYAGLVWGGRPAAGATVGGILGVIAPTPADTNKVKFQAPGDSSYTNLTASATTTNSGNYQSFADVTTMVRAAGNGSYAVGNVQSGQGGDSYAGWALAIAYSDPTAPPRNLTIFRGYGSVASGQSFDFPVSGFITPPSGPVRTTLGAVSYDGDMGLTGDQFLLGPSAASLTNVSDALHAATNTFDSTISDNGVDSSTRNPKYKNQMGFDAATFSVNGFLPNSASSANIRVTSTSETYFPGLITFATELYAPALNASKAEAVVAKAAGNEQPGVLEPGDTIEYTINATNSGQDAATNSVLTDSIPAGTTYVAGSLTSGGVALTDVTGDDVGSFSGAAKAITVNLGAGATSAAGGKLLIGDVIDTITFRVTANADVLNHQVINNIAGFSYAGDLAGTVLTGASNAVTTSAVRHHSNLSISKSADLTRVQRGAATSVTYTLTVANAGPYDEPDATVTDTLPAGAAFGTVTPSSGSCASPVGRTVTCDLGALVNGGTATVVVHAVLDGSADPATDTATVSGTNVDANPANDTATKSTVVNTAPVAVADSATTSGGVVTINVRGNDTDADGDTLTVTAPGTTSPTLGVLVVNANNTVTYTTAAGQVGTDTFSYTVDDGRGGSASALVTVTIPNTAPDANDDASSTTPGNAVTVSVLDNDTDANIPTIGGQHLAVTAVTQPAGGQGTVTRTGTTVTFTPDAGFTHASTSFTYTITDGAGAFDTATVTITMADVGPVAAADTATTSCIAQVIVDVLSNDSDPNDDTLTVTNVSGANHGTADIVGSGANTKIRYLPNPGWSGVDVLHYDMSDGTTTVSSQLTITTDSCSPTAGAFSRTVEGGVPTSIDVLAHATDPDSSHASLTVVGTGPASHGSLSVDSDGTVVYTPDAGYAGPDSFTYTVRDPDGNTSTATVTLTVRNQAPSAHSDATLVPYNGSVDVPVLSNDTDPNGDTLHVTDVSVPANGTATLNPDGSVTYAPDAGFMGTDSFTYTIGDGNGGTDTTTVSVSVANRPPVAVDDSVDFTGTAGAPITIDALANDSDPNGDPVSFDSVSVPLHGTATIIGGNIVYTPSNTYAGADTFTYSISDGRGGHSVATIAVDIHNRAPHGVPDAATTVGGSVTLDVRDNDSDPDSDALSVAVSGPTAPTRGSVSVNASGDVTYTAAAGQAGTDTFSYTISDGRGGSDTSLVTVTIPNTSPHATNDTALTTPGSPVTLTVLGNDTDPNIPTMTDQQLAVSAVTQPAGGDGAVTTDGTTVTFTPSVTFNHGSTTFTYTVSDGAGGFDTATVTVTMSNVAPVAVADTAATTCITAVVVDVLDNDTDGNSDTLTVTAVTGAVHGTTSIVGGTKVRYLPNAGWDGTEVLHYSLFDGISAVSGQLTITTASCGPTAGGFSLTVDGGVATDIDVLPHTSDPDSAGSLTVTTSAPAHGTAVIVAGQVIYTPAVGYAGPDSFTYTVTDPEGNTATATVALTVRNQAPHAIDDTATSLINDSVNFVVLANDSDPNGDPLTITGISIPAHGTATEQPDHSITYQPSLFYGGTDSFTYTVSDGQGGTSTATVTVTIGNAAPVAVADSPTSATSGPSTFDVLANDHDDDNDTLTITTVSIPTHGSVAIIADKIVYTPSAGYTGTDSFSYTIGDGRGGSDSATVSVTVPNSAPVADDDAASTTPGNPVTVTVLGGDTDPNIPTMLGQQLTVSAITQPAVADGTVTTDGTTATFTPAAGFLHGSTTFTYTVTDGVGGFDTATVTITMANVSPVAVADNVTGAASGSSTFDVLANDHDANGDALTITAVSIPGHGTAVVTAGQVVYTPDTGYAGPDSFTYLISDGHGGTDTMTVTVTIPNTAPDAVDDAATSLVNDSVNFVVLANDSDPNGDPLTITAISVPAHGTATEQADHSITYQPSLFYDGTDTFTYTISDGHGGTDIATVTVTVGNAAPIAVADSLTSAPSGPSTFDVLANDHDDDNDTLTITTVSIPTHGSVAIIAGKIVYTPTAGYTGTDSFSYTISDGRGGTDSAAVTVTIPNTAPDAGDDSGATTCITAVVVDVLANDSDANGDTLTVTAVTGAVHGTTSILGASQVRYLPDAGWDGTEVLHYDLFDGTDTVSGQLTVTTAGCGPTANPFSRTVPGGVPTSIDVLAHTSDPDSTGHLAVTASNPAHGAVSIDSDGAVTYTPDTGYAGPDTFTYTVTDPEGSSATATVTLAVANQTPVANDDSAIATGAAGSAVTVDVLANDTDPNSDALTITAVSIPGHGIAVVTAGKVAYTPPATYVGPDSFTYTMSDGNGGTDTATVTVDVQNRAPHAAPDTTTTPVAIATIIDALANDDDPDSEAVSLDSVQATSAHGGTVTLTGDGRFRYVSADGFTGVDTFTYVIVDPRGGTDSGIVTVTVTNASPVGPNLSIPTPGNTAVVVDLFAGATDADGHTVHVASAGPATHGTVALDAAGQATYTPGQGFVGSDTFSYVVSDGQGGVGEATVTVHVGNLAPTAVDDAATTVQGKAVRIAALHNDSDPNSSFVPQGLHVTHVSVASGRGAASVAPDGRVRIVANRRYTGLIVVRYTIADVDGATATADITVTVTPAPLKVARSITIGPDHMTSTIHPNADITGHGKLTVSSAVFPDHGVIVRIEHNTLVLNRHDLSPGSVKFTYVVVGSDGVHITVSETVHLLGVQATNHGGTQPSALPHTGADVVPAGILGVALTLVGAMACLFARRRDEEA